MHDAVLACGDRTAQAALQVLEDAGEILVQRGPVVGEQEHDGGQRTQDHEVHNALQGDKPQDVAVAQRLASQRQGHLIPRWRVLVRGVVRPGERYPRVTAKAPVPAQAARLTSEQLIFGPQRGRVRAEQLVAVQSAADQLIP